MGGMKILVTGAGGFVGRHTVATLRERGHHVLALVRQRSGAFLDWSDDPGIQIIVSDLNSPAEKLQMACTDCDAVVHCAALMSGSDEDHAASTLPMTEQIGRMMPKGAHLVLVSSLSVYDVSAVPAFAVLDEATPLEQDGIGRDAYCRAKLAQESIARKLATDRGLVLSILRPGVIFGPGRLWNSHLGLGFGPFLLRIGRQGQLPLSFVEHTAQAIALAVEQREGCGVVNVIDDDLPDRGVFVKALQRTGWPRVILPLRYSLFSRIAAIGELLPRSPGLFRRKTLVARLQPQRYSNAMLHDRLGWTARYSFEQALSLSIEKDHV